MSGIDQALVSVKHETTVFIFNLSEDVWPFIQAMSDPQVRTAEIDENADLGDHMLFGLVTEDPVLFISPRNVNDEFLQYLVSLFGNQNIRIIKTRIHTGSICDDILRDEAILSEIVKAGNSVRKIQLVSYSASFQFLRLASELRARGLTVTTPEAPEEEDAWTVNFFGSKSGIRQLAQKSSAVEPDFRMADGVIVTGIEDASRVAAKKYIKENGVVVKTNKGHAGAGVLIFRPGDLPADFRSCETYILSILKKDDYWDMFPIIVESFVSIASSVGGGTPNVEFRITRSGRIEFLYYGGMRMSKAGVYQGMEIGRDSLSDQVTAQITDTGFYIAEQYRAAGYKGYFDVDFVASKSGSLYVTESNVRRTGATHVYHMAAKLLGKDFLYDTYILCNSSYQLENKKLKTFRDVKELLTPLLFSKVTEEGIVIVSENSIKNRRILEYVIFGKSKKRALEIEVSMEKLLGGGSMV